MKLTFYIDDFSQDFRFETLEVECHDVPEGYFKADKILSDRFFTNGTQYNGRAEAFAHWPSDYNSDENKRWLRTWWDYHKKVLSTDTK